MKIRINPEGTLIVFPEGNEFRAFKMWLNENSSERNYYDKTAGCYMIKSHSVSDLRKFGFKVTILTKAQYAKIVRAYLETNGAT